MNPEPEKLNGTSLDISSDKKNQLKQLFPTVFTETANDKGELVESVDFEKLKAELGHFSEIFESRRERYGMDWPGKKDALRLIQTPSTATLKPCREESVNFDTTENLFIEGDNLEVLKLLQKSYYGKVKMIYIDPPYNTGKEFIYPDNYSESLQTYLEYAGLVDSEGKRFSTNTANEGRFHTKWLNMMYPRLYLARNLLRDDGVIFISIDDNEVSNLRKLCDEIFGEDNFIANVVWQRTYAPIALKRFFSENHDFLVVYSKDKSNLALNLLPRTDKQDKDYKNPDNDPRGVWKAGNLAVGPAVEKQIYEIITPSGRRVVPPRGYCWRYTREKFNQLASENKIWFGPEGNNVPAPKMYLSEVKNGIVPMTIWEYKDVGHNQESTRELRDIFNESVFTNPKPLRYLKRIINLGSSSKEDIVLDFFAGSATTAHAIIDINQQDSGNRKYIMVQLPEPCAPESEAFNAGYKTISDIGKERIRRVIKKMNEEDEGKLDLQDNAMQDRGFKVLKLNRSNFKQWQTLAPDAWPEKIASQLEMYIDHVDDSASPEDLLYEILIKAGFMPTEKVENISFAGIPVFSIANGDLLICLADQVTKELADAVVQREPLQFICLDSAFHGNDQLKANIVQTFASRNMGREKANQIIFKTI